MVRFSCTNCGKTLQAKEEQVGKEAKCPHCDKLMTIPNTGSGRPRTPVPSATSPVRPPKTKSHALTREAFSKLPVMLQLKFAGTLVVLVFSLLGILLNVIMAVSIVHEQKAKEVERAKAENARISAMMAGGGEVEKTCGKCQKRVSPYAQPGDTCPHCGVLWSTENTIGANKQRNSDMATCGIAIVVLAAVSGGMFLLLKKFHAQVFQGLRKDRGV